MSFDLTGKTIVVLGATGAQGGSVAKYLMEDGKAKVRAVTRKADSPAAKALVSAGAEVVVADANDKSSLVAAFKGAYGVFAVTNFWEHFMGEFASLDEVTKAKKSEEKEIEQGKKIVDAAKEAGIKHFAWSTLFHAKDPKDRVPHFEGKWEIGQYADSQKLPTTHFYTAFYFENLNTFGLLQKNDDDSFTLNIAIPPNTPIPSFSVAQLGGWVIEAFKAPEKWINKDIYTLGSYTTANEYAETLRTLTGKKITLPEISEEAFLAEDGVRKNPYVGLEFWLNMKFFFDTPPGPNQVYDSDLSKEVYPKAYDFKAFVQNSTTLKSYMGY